MTQEQEQPQEVLASDPQPTTATEEPTVASLLDQLMIHDPLEMIKRDPRAIDKLIAYYRHNRKLMAEGIKPIRPKRGAAAAETVKLDLTALGIVKPTVVGVKRRI